VFDLVVNDCAGTLEYATRRAALIKLDFFKLGALFLGQCRCSDFVCGEVTGAAKKLAKLRSRNLFVLESLKSSKRQEKWLINTL
jgi:hypothetical protein